jgi:hypothetical protein
MGVETDKNDKTSDKEVLASIRMLRTLIVVGEGFSLPNGIALVVSKLQHLYRIGDWSWTNWLGRGFVNIYYEG